MPASPDEVRKHSDELVERDGLLVTAATDFTMTDDDVRDLRDADQR